MDKKAYDEAARLLGISPEELAAKIDIPESPAKNLEDAANEKRKSSERLAQSKARHSSLGGRNEDGVSKPEYPSDETREEWIGHMDDSHDAYKAKVMGSDEKFANDKYLNPEGHKDLIDMIHSESALEDNEDYSEMNSDSMLDNSSDVADTKLKQEKVRKKKKVKIRKPGRLK